MAGDKGAEVPKAAKEYLKKPDKPNLEAAQKEFYATRGVRKSPALMEAISRARESLGVKGQASTAENQPPPNESVLEADARFDEAIQKVASAKNPTEAQTTQTEE